MKLKTTLFTLFILLLAYFPIFLHLDSYPIVMWDESRLAVNAFEMSESHNYITITFNGKPDLWNTKPPVMIWLQVGCMKAFGYTELSVRLPSALATLAITLLISFFCYKITKSWTASLCTALALVTSEGFIAFHIARTGDYDALFALFSTLATLSIFLMTEETVPQKKNSYLYLFSLSMLLMVFTKASQGLVLIPAYFVFILIRKQFKWLIFNRNTYFGLLIFLLGLSAYYLIRELNNPGYLAATWANDYWGRFTNDYAGHDYWYYYFELLFNQRFSYWYFAVLLSLFIIITTKNQLLKRIFLYLVICISSILTFITLAQTKGDQYNAAFYPLASILVGMIIGLLYDGLNDALKIKTNSQKIALSALLSGFIFMNPYHHIVQENMGALDKFKWADERIGTYVKEESKAISKNKAVTIVSPHYNAALLFYQKTLNNNGYNFSILWKTPNDSANYAGKTFIIAEQEVKDYLFTSYEYDVLNSKTQFMTVFLKKKK